MKFNFTDTRTLPLTRTSFLTTFWMQSAGCILTLYLRGAIKCQILPNSFRKNKTNWIATSILCRNCYNMCPQHSSFPSDFSWKITPDVPPLQETIAMWVLLSKLSKFSTRCSAQNGPAQELQIHQDPLNIVHLEHKTPYLYQLLPYL